MTEQQNPRWGFAASVLLVAFGLGCTLTWWIMDTRTKKLATEFGCAQFDQRTGDFSWGAPR